MDLKEMFKQAANELETEPLSGSRAVIKDLIKIARRYHFAEKTKSGRVKELREVIVGNCPEEE